MKKSDTTVIDNNDNDIYPTVQVTCGGELPEGATESGNEDNDHDEYSINPDSSIAQLNVTFLLKNRISFIIDHINIHCINRISSKLLNTTSTNLISFPSISLFPQSPNYIHIYCSMNAISFSQKLKITLTYSINKLNIIETDRIEFKLNLPCSRYLRRKTIDSQE
ncbi:unnamed protein product [Rotaria sordida]|uniref:Uncharacterized protein n=1 Tax=Rotaria sordida TaxID=392033 RepID=A0A814LV48_9BILA|nr:unnamed protein product [Rotaria sordida]